MLTRCMSIELIISLRTCILCRFGLSVPLNLGSRILILIRLLRLLQFKAIFIGIGSHPCDIFWAHKLSNFQHCYSSSLSGMTLNFWPLCSWEEWMLQKMACLLLGSWDLCSNCFRLLESFLIELSIYCRLQVERASTDLKATCFSLFLPNF